MIKPSKLALTLGIFFAVVHAVWAIIVGLGYGEKFMNWILGLHFVGTPMLIGGFSIGRALVLIVVTFVIGYILGWLFAAIWNKVDKKCK